MEFHLLILLLSFAKAEEQATHAGSDDQYDIGDMRRRGDIGDSDGVQEQDSLPWANLEQLAELEREAEYTIKVIILTMNRCIACQSIFDIILKMVIMVIMVIIMVIKVIILTMNRCVASQSIFDIILKLSL